MGEAREIVITKCPRAYTFKSAAPVELDEEELKALQDYEAAQKKRLKTHRWGPGRHPRSKWRKSWEEYKRGEELLRLSELSNDYEGEFSLIASVRLVGVAAVSP